MGIHFIAEDECCPAGDITVTPVPSGFMIGRAVERVGPGPWWIYIKVIADYEEAIQFARELARDEGAQAWLYRDGKYLGLAPGTDPQDLPPAPGQGSRPN